jgi:UrcA family protein
MNRLISPFVISALALSPLAHASPVPDTPSLVVHFADLDLAKSEGAATLYRRLRAAAEVVCGQREERDLPKAIAMKQCVQRALAGAVADINRPALTSYYRARNGGGNARSQQLQQAALDTARN